MTSLEIEAFLAICRTGSVTGAAAALYVSQSTLSTRLRLLENGLGCTLFLRQKGRRALELTEEGRRFYGLALQYQEIVDKMGRLSAPRTDGALRVSSINSIGSCLLPPVCQRFLREEPQVRLEVQGMDAEAACRKLEAGETDLALATEPREVPGVSSRPLFREPMAFLCPADAPYSGAVEREALPAGEEIYVPWCGEYIRWHHREFGADSPLIQLEIMTQLQAFLLTRPGWAIVPVTVARDFSRRLEGVRRCRLAFPVPPRTVYCLHRTAVGNRAAFQRFLEDVRGELRGYQDDGVELLP